jgi:hypothetical protein
MSNLNSILDFEQLIRLLETRSSELVREDSENWDDIPDEFLDPILNTIMTDPVLLPCRKTCDRAVIMRHLLSSNTDPFNQLYLDETMLQPNEELRMRIEEWISQKKNSQITEGETVVKEDEDIDKEGDDIEKEDEDLENEDEEHEKEDLEGEERLGNTTMEYDTYNSCTGEKFEPERINLSKNNNSMEMD